MDKKPVLDLDDRNKAFIETAKRLQQLENGFRALSLDYSHHIEVIYFKTVNDSFLDVYHDVGFRIFSAQFHLELLLRQHFVIENEMNELYRSKPKELSKDYYPAPPHFEKYQKEVTAIFDSVIFHLVSVYDYIAGMINFVCNKKDKSITKWSQLLRSCRDKNNPYSQKAIALTLVKTDSEFVQKLYKYRSRIIHEKSAISPFTMSVDLMSVKASSSFYVTNMLLSIFPDFKSLAASNNLTVPYVANDIINKSIDSIAVTLHSLKDEIELMSKYPAHIASNDAIMLFNDPKTGIAYPASKPLWDQFSKFFKI